MDQLACLQAVAAKATEMLAAAEAGDWEALRMLELEERTLTGRLAAQAPVRNAAAQAEEKRLAQAILAKHEAIAALIQPLREDLRILLEPAGESAPGTEP